MHYSTRPLLLVASLSIALLLACKKNENLLSPDQLPEIYSVSDSLVVPGATVTLFGRNFSLNSLNNVVLLNEVALKVISADTRTLYVQMPANPTSGRLLLTVNGVRASGLVPRISIAAIRAGARPIVQGTSKPSGTVLHLGDTLTVYGLNFDTLPHPLYALANHVALGGAPVAVLGAWPTYLKVQVTGGARSGVLTVNVAGLTLTGPSYTIAPFADRERLFWVAGDTGTSLGNPSLVVHANADQAILQNRSDGSLGVDQRLVSTIPYSKQVRNYQRLPPLPATDPFLTNESFYNGELLALSTSNTLIYTNPANGRIGALQLDNPTVRDTLYQFGVDSNIKDPFRPTRLAVDPSAPTTLLVLAGNYNAFALYKGATGGRGVQPIYQVPNSSATYPGYFGGFANPIKLQALAGYYYVASQAGIWAAPTDGSAAPAVIYPTSPANPYPYMYASLLGMCVSPVTQRIYWIETSDPTNNSLQATYLRSATLSATNALTGITTLAVDTFNYVLPFPQVYLQHPHYQGLGSTATFPFNAFYSSDVVMTVIPGGSPGAPADRVYWINRGPDQFSDGGTGDVFLFDMARPNNPPALVFRNAAASPVSLNGGVVNRGGAFVFSALTALY